MSFQHIFLFLGLLTIAGTLVSLRREHIRAEYSVSWLAVGAFLGGLTLFPKTFLWISRALELDPQILFLIVGAILISVLVFKISRVVSRLRDENVLLAQRVAILEFRIGQGANDASFLRTQQGYRSRAADGS